MTRIVRPALALTALLALAACGGQGGTDVADESTAPAPSATSSAAAEGPDCATIWVDGATLPGRYAGCVDDSGALVPADAVRCDSGQTIVTFDDRFYAAVGYRVNDTGGALEDSASYRRAMRVCG